MRFLVTFSHLDRFVSYLCLYEGLLTAIGYGFVADTHGRKIVLWLSCLGGFLSLAWIVVVCKSITEGM